MISIFGLTDTFFLSVPLEKRRNLGLVLMYLVLSRNLTVKQHIHNIDFTYKGRFQQKPSNTRCVERVLVFNIVNFFKVAMVEKQCLLYPLIQHNPHAFEI